VVTLAPIARKEEAKLAAAARGEWDMDQAAKDEEELTEDQQKEQEDAIRALVAARASDVTVRESLGRPCRCVCVCVWLVCCCAAFHV